MRKWFGDNLRAAMIYRKKANLPNINVLIASVTIFTLAYILYAIIFAPAGHSRSYHFVNERGLITVLSAMFLTMASSFSLGSLVVHIREKDSHIWPWVVMALGFAILALDELLLFHEHLGSIIGRYGSFGIFRNWNDVVVILYGVIALPIMGVLLPSIIRYRMILELFAIAFIFYGIHTLIDSTQSPTTTYSIIFEESAKLFCGSFLALGAFVGFLGSLWNSGPSDESQKDE